MAHIMIIDDDPSALEAIAIMVEYLGHSVRMVSSARAGLNLLETEDFDLVLTDIIMPDTDGIEVLLTLRQHRPGLKVVAMSGGGRLKKEDFLHMAERLGADATIAKPFDDEQLESTLSHVLPPPDPAPRRGYGPWHS